MATVILVRHAKGVKGKENEDQSRPLSKKGKNQTKLLAKEMKKFTHHKKLGIDLILTSTAVRAEKTAEKISDKLNIKKANVMVLKDLYLASAEKIERILSSYLNQAKTILVVGHNPGLSKLAEKFTGGKVKKIKTSHRVALQWESEKNTAPQGTHSEEKKSSATTSLPLTKIMPTTTKKKVTKKPVAAKKTVAKKPAVKKAPAKKVAAKKPVAKKTVAKKPAVKKAPAKKVAAKKPAAKKAPVAKK